MCANKKKTQFRKRKRDIQTEEADSPAITAAQKAIQQGVVGEESASYKQLSGQKGGKPLAEGGWAQKNN